MRDITSCANTKSQLGAYNVAKNFKHTVACTVWSNLTEEIWINVTTYFTFEITLVHSTLELIQCCNGSTYSFSYTVTRFKLSKFNLAYSPIRRLYKNEEDTYWNILLRGNVTNLTRTNMFMTISWNVHDETYWEQIYFKPQ
jgi:hypothetical protein